MIDWYSTDNLAKAWKYAFLDVRDDFVFDVLNYQDIKLNFERVISSLHNQLKFDQYHPAPLLRVAVPKSLHSVRPGTVVPIVDLIVLYALAQQIAPVLDRLLSDSAYAYRLNPKAERPREPLFTDRITPEIGAEETDRPRVEVEDETGIEPGFPYAWFENWKAFHDTARAASRLYDHAAVTDITAYFENVSLDLLRESIKERIVSLGMSHLIDRLFNLLEYWDWTPERRLPRGIGLPQGNDISSFLSNLYLIPLDQSMLEIVSGDTSKYGRYVDDVKLFTNDRSEARRALVDLEGVLRRLNLNTQTAKTKIRIARELFDEDVEKWLELMSSENPNKLGNAIEFFEGVFDLREIERWQRPYLRSLTVLREGRDSRAVETALDLFLPDPSLRLLSKHFTYLRAFTDGHFFEHRLANRLADESFIFPYHRAMMFRLAAYTRDQSEVLRSLALRTAIDSSANWTSRMAALFCLSTFALERDELAAISQIVETDANPQVLRAAFVALAQHSGDEFRWVLDRISLFNAPHQDYLRRYFFRLVRNPETAQRLVSDLGRSRVSRPTFIHELHVLDLLKANSNIAHRSRYRDLLEGMIFEANTGAWPRIQQRLKGIFDSFVLRI